MSSGELLPLDVKFPVGVICNSASSPSGRVEVSGEADSVGSVTVAALDLVVIVLSGTVGVAFFFVAAVGGTPLA